MANYVLLQSRGVAAPEVARAVITYEHQVVPHLGRAAEH